ncbi:MAG: D-alanine--D-alanine ligase family protein [Prochlorococcus sp.]|nr:D-alanine--D-alanine ligase family protein [Prochlorococcaceae cyanobacterium ETNP18_MAG_14]
MPSSRSCVGVVFGGESEEHAISIRSAITVIGALRSGMNPDLFEVIPLYIDQLGRWWPASVAEAVLKQGHPPKSEQLPTHPAPKGFTKLPEGSERVEVWYPVLHGPNGEDGTVQGLFSLMGKPFVGAGVLGSALSMDKLAMKAAFAAAGLPQVPYAAVNAADLINNNSREAVAKSLEAQLRYPCFVKPANLGSSVGISKAHNREELLGGLVTAAKLDQRIVVEQGVEAREFECAVLGKRELRASVVGEIRFDADWYDYDTKYTEGCSHTLIPAPLPEEVENQIRKLSLQACHCVAVHGMARVDFFYDDALNELWLNEINTLPGFTSQSMYPMLWEASGVTLEQLVAQLVATARE